jgi:hypothetical protein
MTLRETAQVVESSINSVIRVEAGDLSFNQFDMRRAFNRPRQPKVAGSTLTPLLQYGDLLIEGRQEGDAESP